MAEEDTLLHGMSCALDVRLVGVHTRISLLDSKLADYGAKLKKIDDEVCGVKLMLTELKALIMPALELLEQPRERGGAMAEDVLSVTGDMTLEEGELQIECGVSVV